MEAVLVALIVAGVGVLGQWLLRRQDFARQDQVAARAAEAAKLLLAANERVAETSVATIEKLDVIHTLVNSNMTAAMKAELTATEAQRTLLVEVIALREASGVSTSEARGTLDMIDSRVAELHAALSDRVEQTRLADRLTRPA